MSVYTWYGTGHSVFATGPIAAARGRDLRRTATQIGYPCSVPTFLRAEVYLHTPLEAASR